MDTKELKEKYGKSEQGNFRVVDTIQTPHTYCITPKHLRYNAGVYLDIVGAEKRSREAHPNNSRLWAVCDICRKINKQTGEPILTYEEHKFALVVECKTDIEDPQDEKKMTPELHQWLLKIKDQANRDGYVGFAFIDARPKPKEENSAPKKSKEVT